MFSGFGDFLTNWGTELSKPGALAELQAQEQKQRNLAQVGGVLAGNQVPAFARPGGTEYTPEQFDNARLTQLYALGTPEAAEIGKAFIETPETRLNKSNVLSQIDERKQMNDIRNKQLALQQEELKLSQEDKLRNYNLAVKELDAKLKGGMVDPKELFDRETKLRKEFTDQSKDYITQRDAYDKIAIAAEDPSAAGDISLIYGFMKLNDPTSTVREGEYATAQNAGAIDDRIRSAYNKALSGERLSDKVRNDFVDRSKRLFEGSKRQHDKRVGQYTALAKRAGANPDQVIVDLGLAENPKTAGMTPIPTDFKGWKITPREVK